MTFKRFLAIAFIFGCTAAAWFILGNTLNFRTEAADQRLGYEVTGNWGTPMVQNHPTAYYISPTSARTKRAIQPVQSRIDVNLHYDPKKKGLLWYRTYQIDFDSQYVLKNPTPIAQTFYVNFSFPSEGVRYDQFALSVGTNTTARAPVNGSITESVILEPGAEIPIRITYRAPGMNRWNYSLADIPRVRNFSLTMKTDFHDFDIPAGAESPTSRLATASGWNFVWEYADVIGANSIGMDMPAVINPGPVAARITFFAPVSLLFFFAVLVIMGSVRGIHLHPMNYFFLAAGCFAFQLLLAYLVDIIPTMIAFGVAAAISLLLVTGYLWRVAGFGLARLSAIAQFAYMILFSYSFFFRGLTGITITIGAVITLALLMAFTARVNWDTVFIRTPERRNHPSAGPTSAPVPPPLA